MENDYEFARPGDSLAVPFQCNLCIFRRITNENPKPTSATNTLLLQYIRRANLDSFWSRATSTIRNDLGNVTRSIALLARVGLTGPYVDPGPSPSYDACGYQAAIALLLDSQQKGTYHDDHKQWQSIRKLRTAISNNERASFQLAGIAMVADDNSRSQRFQEGGTSSFWFNRFTQGCSNRMGADIRKNVGLSSVIWSKFLSRVSYKIKLSETDQEAAKWTMGGAYFCISYVCSLRGEEGFLLDIKKLRENRSKAGGLIWLPLIGTVKGDKGTHTYLLRSVPQTDTGIDVEAWRNKLLKVHEYFGREDGPAICDDNGYLMRTRDMNEMLWEIMEELYEEDTDLFPKSITSVEDVRTKIQLYRTMRRSSDSQALRKGVTESDVKLVNRWSSSETSGTASSILYINYSQQDLLNDIFVRYTRVM